MVTVTPAAAEHILASARAGGLEGQGLRLAARLAEGGAIEYGMGFDAAGEGDLQVSSAGITLLVAPAAVELLTGATLDFVEINPGELRFIFVNPNDPAHKTPKA